MMRFSKYEFYNKLLSGVTLFTVISSVTWNQLIYILSIIDYSNLRMFREKKSEEQVNVNIFMFV